MFAVVSKYLFTFHLFKIALYHHTSQLTVRVQSVLLYKISYEGCDKYYSQPEAMTQHPKTLWRGCHKNALSGAVEHPINDDQRDASPISKELTTNFHRLFLGRKRSPFLITRRVHARPNSRNMPAVLHIVYLYFLLFFFINILIRIQNVKCKRKPILSTMPLKIPTTI